MDSSSSSQGLPLHLIITGTATLFFGLALSIILLKNKQSKDINKDDVPEVGTISCENSAESTSTSEQTKDAYPGGQILIFYGSQTGTAESFATSMAGEATTHGFKAKALDLEDVTEDGPENLQSMMRDCGRALFLVSTYGEGEPTTSAVTMVDFMKKKLGDEESEGGEIDGEWMKGVDYAVFGLGNTEYEYYNMMGKYFDASLEKLGGNRVLDLGLGDDNDDLEGDFENWKGLLWTAFTERYIGTKEPTVVEVKEEVREATFTLEYLTEQESLSSGSENLFSHDDIHTSAKHYFDYETLTVKTNNELLTPSPKYPNSSTRHIELSLPPQLSYYTADNLAVLPINATSIVTAVANALNYSLDATFKLTPRDVSKKHAHPFPTPCTVRTFLERYCDLTTPPRRGELKLLAGFASDPLDRAALLRLSDKDGRKEYKEKILEAHVGLVDIITQLTPSVKVPLEHFVDICAKLQPRQYTIASSSSVHGGEVHLTLAVVKEERKDKSMFEGVCSNYLKNLKVGDSVRAFIQPSTFRLPENPSTPIIMIGPGTGIAPMRAMIQERAHQKQTLKQPVGPTILYFGCKHATIDYIYKNELISFEKDGTLTECNVAFSRDGTEKEYVQHLLAKNTTNIWNLIDDKGAYVYVCGGIKMGHDVVNTLKTIIMESKGVTLDEATEYCQKLHHDKRLVQELWA